MYEHLPVNQAMREKLLSGDDYFNIFKTIFQDHLGSSLLDDGLDKVSRGLIKLDDLLALTNECL
jgi:type II secretory ATPase GspE/PulE/Tfp pilus assembly ATPase PilB-like protein